MSTHAQKRPTDIDTQFRELARRSNNGVDVTLSWDAETDELLVCVYDARRDVYQGGSIGLEQLLDVGHAPFLQDVFQDGPLLAGRDAAASPFEVQHEARRGAPEPIANGVHASSLNVTGGS